MTPLPKVSPHHVLARLFDMAAREPDRVVITFVDERGKDGEVRTASALVEGAMRLAGHLQERCGLSRGDVVLLVYPPSMEFVESFVACLLAGLVPAPVYPPHPVRPEGALPRLCATAAQAQARAILTSRSYRFATRLGTARQVLTGAKARWPDLPWFVTDSSLRSPSGALAAVDCQPGDLALLQFTSGSTSLPKGVRLTHGNLLHQLEFNAERLKMGRDARFVAWVPQYHDLGLISGILGALHGNGGLWMLSPQTFLADAALWPATMHRVRATHTASPNFGFELVTRRTTPEQRAAWDLRTLRVVMSAAEPIVPRTVDAFFDAFAPTGLSREAFCPAYGLAEHTVGITLWGRDRVRVDRATLIREGLARVDEAGDVEFIGCGRPSDDIAVRIVDLASGAALDERRVGEIWARSRSVADGYDRAPEATAASFAATLPGEGGGWLRTGDLGFIHRGELYVTGRLKDLVILRGRNMHPEDLEEAVRFVHPDVRPGGLAAFAVPGDATEALVLVAEVKDPKTADVEGAIRALDRKVLETWQIPATIVLVPPGTVPKTTSGKLQRAACRRLWMEGALPTLRVAQRAPVAPRADVAGPALRAQLDAVHPDERLPWLLDVVQQVAVSARLLPEATPVGPDDFLPALGLDSLASTQLLAALEKALDHRVPASLFIEHPTFRSAAARVLRELGVEFTDSTPPAPVFPPMPFRPLHRPMAPAQTRVAVVGGGVGGLVSALELARLGYRDIVVFESASRCGGKVLTQEMPDGSRVELGAQFILDTHRVVIELATDLGLELVPSDREFFHFADGHGVEEGPAAASGLRALRAILQAAKLETNPALPFPSLLNLDETLGEFLRRHRLRTPHPRFWYVWSGMGYGIDLDTPAAYVLAYLQLVAGGQSSAHLRGGNQALWTTLAAHLEQRWGVAVRTSTRVSHVRGDDTGVSLSVNGVPERFDEVILAAPPHALHRMLDESDPLQPLLSELSHVRFKVQSFQAEGLPRRGVMFAPERVPTPGSTVLMQPSSHAEGWYVSGQYSATGRLSAAETLDVDADKLLPAEALQAELAGTVAAMGGTLTALGPSRDWIYFPHALANPVSLLRHAESLQGARHLWTTGSWLAFESVESVARHARHLVQTCFDPAGGD